MTPGTSGPTWLAPSAFYDPGSSSWKTSGAIFPSDWPTSSETCPAWGMTRGGELYELPTPVLPTDVPASSSSPNLPTPVTTDQASWTPGDMRRNSPGLRALPALLPTPVADHSRGNPSPTTDYQSLPNVACALLPTPTAMDSAGSRGYRPDGTPYTATAGVTLTDAAWSISGHTPPPSNDGNEPSGGPLPTPPSPAATDDPDCLPLSWNG